MCGQGSTFFHRVRIACSNNAFKFAIGEAGKRRGQCFAALALVVVLGAVPVAGQVQLGENLEMTLNGFLGVGYGGEFGNTAGVGSGHNIFLEGQGTFAGSFYDPRFLNFQVVPFYNRNQENASQASVFNETGLTSSVNLFGGSHFPGTISYANVWNDGSQYGLGPGVSALGGNGRNQTFDISWSALFPDWPTLTATFSQSSMSDQILGETGTIASSVRTFSLFSNYTWHKYSLFANFAHQNYNADFPEFLGGSQSQTSNNSYSFGATHSLPMNGSFSVAYSHSKYNGGADQVVNSGSASTVSGGFSLTPTDRFSLGGSARYYTNLVGALQNTVLPPGTLPVSWFNIGTDGYAMNAFGSYAIGHGFGAVAYAGYGAQHFQGQTIANRQYGATLTYRYGRPLFGMLYFSLGVVNTAGNGNQGSAALVGSLGLKKQIGPWDMNADASYSQDLQNSIAWFTTSNYNYGGYVRRRVGEFLFWTASARDVRTGITQFTGYNNNSQTFMTSLTRKGLALSLSYGQSHGTSILTSSGTLVPVVLPPGLLPGETLYNGSSYGGTFSIIPMRRMQISTSWFRVSSDTLAIPAVTDAGVLPPPVFSNNDSDRIYAVMTYKVRKLNFLATYWRLNQQIGAAGLPSAIQNNYSFTISRWFNVF